MCYVKTKNNYNGKAWHIIYFNSGKIIKSLFNKIMQINVWLNISVNIVPA